MDISQSVPYRYLMNFRFNDSYKNVALKIQDSQNFNVHQGYTQRQNTLFLIRWSNLMLLQKKQDFGLNYKNYNMAMLPRVRSLQAYML